MSNPVATVLPVSAIVGGLTLACLWITQNPHNCRPDHDQAMGWAAVVLLLFTVGTFVVQLRAASKQHPRAPFPWPDAVALAGAMILIGFMASGSHRLVIDDACGFAGPFPHAPR